jgi:hypothetical protein
MGRSPERRRRAPQRFISLETLATTGKPAHAGRGVWEAADGVAPVSEGPYNTVHQTTKGRRGWPLPAGRG